MGLSVLYQCCGCYGIHNFHMHCRLAGEKSGRIIAADEDVNDMEVKAAEEIEELIAKKETKDQVTSLSLTWSVTCPLLTQPLQRMCSSFVSEASRRMMIS
ncbi:hypothetical protein OUZ56_006019 [Daphnia magna]|uniref:Uncharacterized protein n=1 Tax=Daphnia magna TaxID=35525 RepID=A0ABQ9YUG3_9CRUS|nr:hypothetical protein OUZ56_006019 [Daphnia magna]